MKVQQQKGTVALGNKLSTEGAEQWRWNHLYKQSRLEDTLRYAEGVSVVTEAPRNTCRYYAYIRLLFAFGNGSQLYVRPLYP
jgi:hypothetical protein